MILNNTLVKKSPAPISDDNTHKSIGLIKTSNIVSHTPNPPRIFNIEKTINECVYLVY